MVWSTGPSQFDPDWMTYAINEIESTYGDKVFLKGKSLDKFGRNPSVGTTRATIMDLQGSETNETFVSTNIIDGISSDDQLNDVGITLVVEGHTIDGSGNLTFVVQDATLDGTDARTEVTLTTPLARCTRAYVKDSGTFNSPQADLTGNIYIYDNTGGVAATGIPNTASGTKCMISAGSNQSEKCATSISSVDYWIVHTFSAALGNATPTADRVQVRIQRRNIANGGVWRPIGRDISLEVGGTGIERHFTDPVIIPPNHDVRAVAQTNTGTAEVFAEIRGVLAKIG